MDNALQQSAQIGYANFDSQEMTTNQYLDTMDNNIGITIRKVAIGLTEFGSTCDSIAGSPENGLTTSWDGSSLR